MKCPQAMPFVYLSSLFREAAVRKFRFRRRTLLNSGHHLGFIHRINQCLIPSSVQGMSRSPHFPTIITSSRLIVSCMQPCSMTYLLAFDVSFCLAFIYFVTGKILRKHRGVSTHRPAPILAPFSCVLPRKFIADICSGSQAFGRSLHVDSSFSGVRTDTYLSPRPTTYT